MEIIYRILIMRKLLKLLLFRLHTEEFVHFVNANLNLHKKKSSRLKTL